MILHSSDIAASEYGSQIAISSTNVQEKGFSSKTKFVIKILLQFQIMNNISTYSIPTTKRIVVKHSLRLLLSLIFASWCLPYKYRSLIRLQQQSANIFGLHFPPYLFSIWEIPDGTICHVYQKLLPCLQEKNSIGKAENEVSMTYYTP